MLNLCRCCRKQEFADDLGINLDTYYAYSNRTYEKVDEVP